MFSKKNAATNLSAKEIERIFRLYLDINDDWTYDPKTMRFEGIVNFNEYNKIALQLFDKLKTYDPSYSIQRIFSKECPRNKQKNLKDILHLEAEEKQRLSDPHINKTAVKQEIQEKINALSQTVIVIDIATLNLNHQALKKLITPEEKAQNKPNR